MSNNIKVNLSVGKGLPGKDGVDGKGLEYDWRGTELGIRKEGEIEYIYRDLECKGGGAGLTPEQEKNVNKIPTIESQLEENTTDITELKQRPTGGLTTEQEAELNKVKNKADKITTDNIQIQVNSQSNNIDKLQSQVDNFQISQDLSPSKDNEVVGIRTSCDGYGSKTASERIEKIEKGVYIRNKSITPEKLSFITPPTNRNVFIDKSLTVGWFDTNGDITSGNTNISEFIYVKPDTKYKMQGTGSTSGARSYKKDGTVIGSLTITSNSFTTPSECYMVKIAFSPTTTNADNWIIQEGEAITPIGDYTINGIKVPYLDQGLNNVKDIAEKYSTHTKIVIGSGKCPNIDTTIETLTIYKDTILLHKTGYYIIDADKSIALTGLSSAIMLIYNIDTNDIYVKSYNYTKLKNEILIGAIRYVKNTIRVMDIGCPYTVNGIMFDAPFATKTYVDNSIKNIGASQKNEIDSTMKCVAHRGYYSPAQENTLPAFMLAKKNGYSYVETDISWTSDNVPVLLHDITIDRTSNGTGNIDAMTLSTAKSYEFGTVDYPAKIPTFDEFILYCKKVNLHPVIELKNGEITESRAIILSNIIKKYNMENRATFQGGNLSYLTKIFALLPNCNYGLINFNQPILQNVTDVKTLKNNNNDAYICFDSSYLATSESIIAECRINNIAIAIYTVVNSTICNLASSYGVDYLIGHNFNMIENLIANY